MSQFDFDFLNWGLVYPWNKLTKFQQVTVVLCGGGVSGGGMTCFYTIILFIYSLIVEIWGTIERNSGVGWNTAAISLTWPSGCVTSNMCHGLEVTHDCSHFVHYYMYLYFMVIYCWMLPYNVFIWSVCKSILQLLLIVEMTTSYLKSSRTFVRL